NCVGDIASSLFPHHTAVWLDKKDARQLHRVALGEAIDVASHQRGHHANNGVRINRFGQAATLQVEEGVQFLFGVADKLMGRVHSLAKCLGCIWRAEGDEYDIQIVKIAKLSDMLLAEYAAKVAQEDKREPPVFVKRFER